MRGSVRDVLLKLFTKRRWTEAYLNWGLNFRTKISDDIKATYLKCQIMSVLSSFSHPYQVTSPLTSSVKILSPVAIKQQAYFTLVRPLVEYPRTVWDPHTDKNIKKLEMVQRRAARFVTSRHHNKSSVSDMLEGLNWRSLEDRRKDARLCMLYKIDRQLGCHQERQKVNKIQETLFHVGFNITINISYLSYFPTNIYKAN